MKEFRGLEIQGVRKTKILKYLKEEIFSGI
jgi:hypothetical protein